MFFLTYHEDLRKAETIKRFVDSQGIHMAYKKYRA